MRVKSYDHFNFSRAYVVQFRPSRYIMRLNRTSKWKVMTIWISRELSMFNFARLYMWYAWIEHPCEKLWPFEFSRASVVQFRASRHIMCPNLTSQWKVVTIRLLKSFHCSISTVSIYYAPQSDLQIKSYEHLNFSRASVVQFRATRYVMRLNRTCEWKVMTIWISRELSLFNFERLIYYVPESDLQVKSYDHLNF